MPTLLFRKPGQGLNLELGFISIIIADIKPTNILTRKLK